jgi:catechol 2,3-dioxygenase-like lactoylglutathione lyase family enzyme
MILSATRSIFTGLVLLFWVLASTAFARALEVKAITLSVSDLDRSIAFFEQALNFKKTGEKLIADREHDYALGVFGARVRRATLALGDEVIHLEQFISPTGDPIPVDSRSNDLWFQHFAIVVSDMDNAFAHVQKFPITGISSAPQTIPESNKGAAGIKAYKFRDPDGHPLELLYFPADKGNPKWQRPEGRLFLGIDHTAIGIGSTERSTKFYSELLGFRVAGAGVNTGITQEQLDNAFGAVVRITGLRPERAQGPGLEFLQYVTPSGGRLAPVDKAANDLVATRLVLEVDNIDQLAEQLSKQSVTFISPRVIAVPGEAYEKCLMVKDPDGHMVMLVQQ